MEHRLATVPPRAAVVTLPALIVAGAVIAVALVPGLDAEAWQGAWATADKGALLRGSGTTTALITSTTLLSLCIGLAVGSIFGRWPRPLRLLLAPLLAVVAFFPVTALLWAFVGWWGAELGWPIESLVPATMFSGDAPVELRLAVVLWKWLLPILLMSIAPAAFLALRATAQIAEEKAAPQKIQTGEDGGSASDFWGDCMPRAWSRLRRSLGGCVLLAGAGGAVVEHVLAMQGVGGAWIGQMQARVGEQAAVPFLVWAVTLAVLCLLVALVPAGPKAETKNDPYRYRAMMEGAVVAGVPKSTAWRRHVLPHQIRRAAAWICEAAAWLTVLAVVAGSVVGQWPGQEFAAAGASAFKEPTAPLRAAVPAVLCALSLWLLSHIVRPRPTR